MFKSRVINFVNNGETDNSKLLRSIIVFFSSILLFVFVGFFLYKIVLLTKLYFSVSIETIVVNINYALVYVYSNILPNYLLMAFFLSTVIISLLSKIKIGEDPRFIEKYHGSEIVLLFSCVFLMFYSFINFLDFISQENINSTFYNFLSYLFSAFFLYLGIFTPYLILSTNITDIAFLIKKDVQEKKKIKYFSIIYFIFTVICAYYQNLWFISAIVLGLLYLTNIFMLSNNYIHSYFSVLIMENRGYDFSKNLKEEPSLGKPHCISLSRLNHTLFNELSIRFCDRSKITTNVRDIANKNNINRNEILVFHFSKTSSKVYVFDLDNKLLKIINY